MLLDNFKFNFLSRGQLESLNLDKIFLPLFKILPCLRGFFGNLIFAIIARMLCGNHLNSQITMKLAKATKGNIGSCTEQTSTVTMKLAKETKRNAGSCI